MNRHIRTRHPGIFMSETVRKRRDSYVDADPIEFAEVDTPMAIKTEEIAASDKDIDESFGEFFFLILHMVVWQEHVLICACSWLLAIDTSRLGMHIAQNWVLGLRKHHDP